MTIDVDLGRKSNQTKQIKPHHVWTSVVKLQYEYTNQVLQENRRQCV